MPTFQYEALNTVGQTVKGEVEASSNEDAASKVRAMGNFPTKVKEKAVRRRRAPRGAAAPAEERARRRTVGRISPRLLSQFTRQLSTLIDAGLPILRSLRILEQQQKPGPMRLAIRLVAEDVEAGVTLSDAMARHPKAFNALYTNMIRAGEVGGVLDVILLRLADFLEKNQALKRKVIGAMIYPIAVVSFAVLIVMGIMMWVIPSFTDIFKEMGRELPVMTQQLINISNWIRLDYGWLVIILSPLTVWLIIRFVKMSPAGRYAVDRVRVSVPIFGKIVRKTGVERFSRTLGTLLSAGVPILDALNITRETAGNEVFARALGKVRDGTYADEVATTVSSLISLLEPAMVIFLGLVVGYIVISLFMPMVSMLQAMQRQG